MRIKQRIVVESHIDRIVRQNYGANSAAIEEIGDAIVEIMRRKVPVESGDLKKTIYNEVDGQIGYAGAGGVLNRGYDYARKIEFKDHPFIRPAGLAVKRNALRIIKEKQLDFMIKGKVRPRPKKKK
jgi:hypothetical protein